MAPSPATSPAATATTTALADPAIVSRILHHLSDMKYKSRRQLSPTSPVELLEFRPTLVPAILVNKLWADAGTSILWKRYPHLPALRGMERDRRRWYAEKVERAFAVSAVGGRDVDGEEKGEAEGGKEEGYLDGLAWPRLRALELEVDFGGRYGKEFLGLLGTGLESLEIAGVQTGGGRFFEETLLPGLFNPDRCRKNLKTVRFGPGLFPADDPADATALIEWLDALPQLTSVDVKGSGFSNMDKLFAHLSHHPNLEALEIDLEPGVDLLPLLSAPRTQSLLFPSLKKFSVMCYPEIALALPGHLPKIEELQFDLCRLVLPSQHHDSDHDHDHNHTEQDVSADRTLIEALISRLSACPRLTSLKLGIGALSPFFPSSTSFPILSGCSLVLLSQYCPQLAHLNLFAGEPSSIDASDISSDEFEKFCRGVPGLRSLVLKLHPGSVSQELGKTALKSLGTWCRALEVLRLRIPLLLPDLPPPSSPSHSSSEQPRFPQLTHLALARPQTALSPTEIEEPVSPEQEACLVQSWASALLGNFSCLEVLEAWSDYNGAENESLNYFLPREEALASCWEFLCGCEQDLWGEGDEEGGNGELEYNENGGQIDLEEEDDGELGGLEQAIADMAIGDWTGDADTYEEEEEGGEFVEGESGVSESSLDWEAASYLNEYVDAGAHTGTLCADARGFAEYVDEEEGEITPGRGLDLNVDPFSNKTTTPALQPPALA